ncbi:hypothetical protein ACFLQR_03100 [Verrucomicrobiota bacterium]
MGVIEKGKKLFKLAQQIGSIEIQQNVIELQSDILELQEEVQSLRKENEELNDNKKIDDELILQDNAYWRTTGEQTRKGPFCTRCWDTDKKLVNLTAIGRQHPICPTCEKIFPTEQSSNATREGHKAKQEALRTRQRRSLPQQQF